MVGNLLAHLCLVDQRRSDFPLGQFSKQAAIQDASGMLCDRQQADQNFAAIQEGCEFRIAGKTVDTLQVLGGPAPAGHLETEGMQLGRRVLTQNPQAHHAHPYLSGGAL